MKKQLLKKLSALIIIFVILFSLSGCQKEIGTNDPINANAKIAGLNIIYIDVNPDSTIRANPSQQYSLDLNNDGVSDFTFSVYGGMTRCSGICSGIQTNVAVSPISGSRNKIEVDGGIPSYPLALDTLSVIDNSDLWSAASGQILRSRKVCFCMSGIAYGNWNNPTDKYLGLKLIKGTNTYYGWVRLSVNTSGPGAYLIIRDYAYNSISNKAILAGQRK